ncbi:hypothetical protein SKAU_G00281080 [Synaphobranchus kaupii]|uniref:Uncharacterized protein n=1 Tax=Synaphobranchus kaupii TaxID=118154 RepID=A0A9Q1EX90_SYNKA|nr:hypothetical protein SKAU_G00281080 [Synaphobranchus kaupii]
MAKREAQKEYTESHKEVKKSIKQDKRKYVDNLAQQAEEAARKRNMKEVYDITRKLAGRPKGRGLVFSGHLGLEDLDFADNLALMSHTLPDMQKKVDKLTVTSSKSGLNINRKKTEAIRVNNRSEESVKLNGEQIADVEEFTYLGSMVNKEGGSDRDITARIGKASSFHLFESSLEVKSDRQKD